MKKYFKNNSDIEKTMMLFDQKFYLPDDLVVKMERASMASSLETRSPFLHHEIVEFANSLPLNYKIFKNQGKIITRSILEDFLPKKFLFKKEEGVSCPIRDTFKRRNKKLVRKYFI